MPDVKVPHLASNVLSLSCRRIAEDWRLRYGNEPVLLETYVEHNRFKGTSYRAANWHCVGQSQGRGRQDRTNQKALLIKGIYVFPLCSKYREMLSDDAMINKPVAMAPKVTFAAEDHSWVEQEFGRGDE